MFRDRVRIIFALALGAWVVQPQHISIGVVVDPANDAGSGHPNLAAKFLGLVMFFFNHRSPRGSAVRTRHFVHFLELSFVRDEGVLEGDDLCWTAGW